MSSYDGSAGLDFRSVGTYGTDHQRRHRDAQSRDELGCVPGELSRKLPTPRQDSRVRRHGRLTECGSPPPHDRCAGDARASFPGPDPLRQLAGKDPVWVLLHRPAAPRAFAPDEIWTDTEHVRMADVVIACVLGHQAGSAPLADATRLVHLGQYLQRLGSLKLADFDREAPILCPSRTS